MNFLINILDPNLVDMMIVPKVVELRKEKLLYELFELRPAIIEFYFGEIYNDMLYKINNVIDGGFAKKYECVEADDDDGNPLDISFIEYDGHSHVDDGCGGLTHLDQHSGLLITTKYGKYLIYHFMYPSAKINKFKCKYKNCCKIEWLNGYDLKYN